MVCCANILLPFPNCVCVGVRISLFLCLSVPGVFSPYLTLSGPSDITVIALFPDCQPCVYVCVCVCVCECVFTQLVFCSPCRQRQPKTAAVLHDGEGMCKGAQPCCGNKPQYRWISPLHFHLP